MDKSISIIEESLKHLERMAQYCHDNYMEDLRSYDKAKIDKSYAVYDMYISKIVTVKDILNKLKLEAGK